MKKTIFYTVLLLAALSAFSCKKKDDDTTKPSLTGLAIDSDYDNYMGEGATVHLQADISKLASSDSKYSLPETIGIYYSVNAKRDTVTTDARVYNPTFSFEVEDAGTYTIYCYAFAGDDFYNASASISFTVVDPATAIEGLPELPTIEIDGHTFLTIEQGGKTWMANNLYGTTSGTEPMRVTGVFRKCLIAWKAAGDDVYGAADILVDGEKVMTLEGGPGKWGQSEVVLVLDEREAAEHTIEIRVTEEGKRFTVTAVSVQ